jgi:hypothetical protein
MFKRVVLEEWATIVPIIAFVVLFGVFLVTTLRAVRMRPAERDRMSNLPLAESNEEPEENPIRS